MHAPFVSVVIPAYNEGERLPRFVAELTRVFLERSAPPVEFVVVDDGSAPKQAELQRASVEAAQARLATAGARHQFTYVAAPRNQERARPSGSAGVTRQRASRGWPSWTRMAPSAPRSFTDWWR
ncbi:glycosyltransferase [Myxococcus sp. MxC21-1]|uniref:glycosyltransferase n=1 Tax=Myxococcus sp. MxC21-1 TaxID=3041439 RepID=UPI00292CB986|nr:glycosyltransferase [Myxococcus sp. MxC21-1]WNZ60093.1 glycosyltransferase [Myxococcus sp. MxC21-1]